MMVLCFHVLHTVISKGEISPHICSHILGKIVKNFMPLCINKENAERDPIDFVHS